MSHDHKRVVELRFIVIALVDITEPSLTEALSALDNQPSSLADVVSSEIVSNLESVSYVQSVIVSRL